MQIEIEVTKKEKRTIEVSFPIYFKSDDSTDGGWWENYYRIDKLPEPLSKFPGSADGIEIELTVRGSHSTRREEAEYEVETTYVNLANALGHYMRPDQYDAVQSSEAEFYKILDEFKARLAALPSPTTSLE
jgi:hypothetical protein